MLFVRVYQRTGGASICYDWDIPPAEACERWFGYRDNRNHTAHDYGEAFAEATLGLLPSFIADARDLAQVIEEGQDD